jgi:hypothetical protein
MIMFKVYYLLLFISNIISFLQMFWSNKIKEILVLVSIFNNYEESKSEKSSLIFKGGCTFGVYDARFVAWLSYIIVTLTVNLFDNSTYGCI